MKQIQWINILRGYAMGISDLIPGVSGGTIALLLGIYDDFIQAISGLFSKHFKKNFLFLLPLGIGIILAIGTLSKLISYLLEYHVIPTQFFFLGLIAGIIPFLLRLSKPKENFKLIHYIVIIIGVLLLLWMSLNQMEKTDVSSVELTTPMLIQLYFAGILASSAMLLPGISGSFVLLLLGFYSIVIYSVSEVISFNFDLLPVIIAVGLGFMTGFIVSSKLINYMLTHFTYLTYSLIIGLVIGSLFNVFPGLPNSIIVWIITVFTFTIGFLVSYTLGNKTLDEMT